jgi:hypothetical protein
LPSTRILVVKGHLIKKPGELEDKLRSIRCSNSATLKTKVTTCSSMKKWKVTNLQPSRTLLEKCTTRTSTKTCRFTRSKKISVVAVTPLTLMVLIMMRFSKLSNKKSMEISNKRISTTSMVRSSRT